MFQSLSRGPVRMIAGSASAAHRAHGHSHHGPVGQAIERKLREALSPSELVIRNDSHHHAGHSGNPTGAADAETHFTVEVRSDRFHGLGLLHRHRHINELLKEEFSKGLHALSIKAKAPGEP